MENSRFKRTDIFSRQTLLNRRAQIGAAEIRNNAETAGCDAFMEGFVAAAMTVAYADGSTDPAERRKLIAMFRANPAFDGFSVEELAEEMAIHARSFSYDPATGRERALTLLREAKMAPSETLAVIAACKAVILADSLAHPAELGALHLVGKELGHDNQPDEIEVSQAKAQMESAAWISQALPRHGRLKPMIYVTRYCGLTPASMHAAIRQGTETLDSFLASLGHTTPDDIILIYRNRLRDTITLDIGYGVAPKLASSAKGEVKSGRVPANQMLSAEVEASVAGLLIACDELDHQATTKGGTRPVYFWQHFTRQALHSWPAGLLQAPACLPSGLNPTSGALGLQRR